jgi:hypothetical protein
MGPSFEGVSDFVSKWLRRRTGEPAAREFAVALCKPLPTMLASKPAGHEIAGRFVDLVGTRLGAVIALARLWAGEQRPSSSNPGDIWRREARQLETDCHLDDINSWWPDLLELTEAGNGLVTAVVASSLDEALDPARSARPPLPSLRQLRNGDEAPYQDLTVPPAPGASWDPEDYFVKPEGTVTIDLLAPVLEAFDVEGPDRRALVGPLSPREAARQAELGREWERLTLAFHAGQPVSKGQLLGLLKAVRGVWTICPPRFAASIDAAFETVGKQTTARSALRTVEPVSPGDRALADLAATLECDESSVAQGFARRVGQILAASRNERVRLVLGGLIYLDELENGTGPTPAWVRSGRGPLLALARGFSDCEVLDEGLIGRQLGQVADLVTSVGIDGQARPGVSNRITRVVRPGYAVRLSDGSRQVLVPARVRIAP